MEIVGIGVDLVEVERVHRMMGRHRTFVERVFTAGEIAYCQSQASPAECFAARWAAREACRKALGGVRGMRWHDVRVERANGVPELVRRYAQSSAEAFGKGHDRTVTFDPALAKEDVRKADKKAKVG